MQARHWLAEVERLDVAAYAAIAQVNSAELDRAMQLVSRAADYSRLWIGAAGLLTLAGGEPGRRAALDGLASIAVTSIVVNAGMKPLGRRRRPDAAMREVPFARHVRMPISRSFPSGHSASAFAFAAGVAATQPWTALPLHFLAALVAYSRVHTGVHFPGDVLAGSLLGVPLARLTLRVRQR